MASFPDGLKLLRLDAIAALSLRERARSVIRSSILTGQIAPGHVYTAGYFAKSLGVSATPIREALLDLANDGLVEFVRNRGFRIPLASEQDLDEIFELRLMLEVPSVGRLAGRLDDGTAQVCARYAEKMVDCAQSRDLGGFLEADRLFHLKLLGALQNRLLVEIVGKLRDRTPLYALPHLAESGQLLAAAQEHNQILEAIVRGDKSDAVRQMSKHLRHTRGVWVGLQEQPAAGEEYSSG